MIADLPSRFGYHPPASAAEIHAHETIRSATHECAELIASLTPPSREQALAITKIEEAMMWANAAIARNVSAPKNAEK